MLWTVRKNFVWWSLEQPAGRWEGSLLCRLQRARARRDGRGDSVGSGLAMERLRSGDLKRVGWPGWGQLCQAESVAVSAWVGDAGRKVGSVSPDLLIFQKPETSVV